VALATTTEMVKAASDDLRLEWETHAAPRGLAWFSLLLTGGPGGNLGRHLLRGECYFPASHEDLTEAGRSSG
jgi:hypothetical protein